MYSRKSWGGDVDPFILAKFSKTVARKDEEDPLLSLVIFEWEDVDLIGVVPEGEDEDDSGYVRLICLRTRCRTAANTHLLVTEKDHMRPTQRRSKPLR